MIPRYVYYLFVARREPIALFALQNRLDFVQFFDAASAVMEYK
jgi:hypothetical protein